MTFLISIKLLTVVFICFLISGLCQTFWLKSKAFSFFAWPLDFGLSFRGKRIFGGNKTFAVFIVMPLATTVVFGCAGIWLIQHYPHLLLISSWPTEPSRWFLLGFLASLGFILGELPNSFIKRRIGIAPGANPETPGLQKLFFIIDQTDSVLGTLIFMSFMVPTGWRFWLMMLIIAPGIHWLFNVLLFLIGVKDKPC